MNQKLFCILGAPIFFLPAVQCLSYSLENTFHVVLDSLSTYSLHRQNIFHNRETKST